MKKTKLLSFGAIVIAAAGMTACGSDKTEPGKDAPATTAAPAKTTPPAATATTTAAATATATATATAEAPAGPNGRSAVPTLDDWKTASDALVKGAKPNGCEAKRVREWIRVSCRDKNATGGEPKAVTIKKGGGRGDTFAFSASKVTSLVYPFAERADIEAEFEWTDGKKMLVVSWPYGAPEPPSKGEFR